MDSYRDHPSDFEPTAAEPAGADEAVSAIGSDERRMHVRAYNYWVSLLGGRDYPSIEDLEPGEVEDFAANSVLLDFTAGRDNPATPYIGTAIREECGLQDEIKTIADVPARSLLSRLTDHYMQIIANRAPVGFEAEFENQRGEEICYRGILMPFSSDGDTIDFIYGVINWKRHAADAAPSVVVPMLAPEEQEEAFEPTGIAAAVEAPAEPASEPTDAPPHFSWEDGPLAEESGEDGVAAITIDEDAGLADRLWAARETVEAAKNADGRSRAALYQALAMAYDFALAAEQSPEDYAELLEESGVRAQARAPMTPIVKLVFGVDYDKARLTEFAAALSYARRENVGASGFREFIDRQSGGLKALVALERQARRPAAPESDRRDAARDRLRIAQPVPLESMRAEVEFALVVTRRRPDGSHEPVAFVDDPALVERAIRKAAA